MSENSFPTSLRPATKVATKSRGLSIVNWIMAIIVVISAVATVALLSLAASRSAQVRELTNDTEKTKKRTLEIKAANWCDQIIPDNAEKVPDLYKDYDAASYDLKAEIERQCKARVSIAEIIRRADPLYDFTVDPECTLNESQGTASCTATVNASPTTMRLKLANYPSTTATLRMRVADTQTSLVTQPHVIDNVATVTLDSSGSGTVTFDVPVDPSWGSAYDIQVSSFFPNE